jgi:hypothetical protein
MTPEQRQQTLADIDESLDRWFRKLKRAANAIDQLRAKRKRLVAPRKLLPHGLEPDYGGKRERPTIQTGDETLNDMLAV